MRRVGLGIRVFEFGKTALSQETQISDRHTQFSRTRSVPWCHGIDN